MGKMGQQKSKATRTTAGDTLCDTLGIHPSTLRRWSAAGCPHDHRPGRSTLFNEAEVVVWMRTNNRTGRVGRPAEHDHDTDAELLAARVRKELALAALHERRVARERERLADRAEVREQCARKYEVVRVKFLSIPPTVAPAVAAASEPHEVDAILDSAARAVLTELSQMRDDSHDEREQQAATNGSSVSDNAPSGMASPDALVAARTRKENALAEQYEIQLAEEKGSLVVTEQVEQANAHKFTELRINLLSMAGAFSARLMGLAASQVETRVRTEITDFLRPLDQLPV